MANKHSQPYQPLLLRILHGITSLLAIAAIVTAFWTYDIYDGRWGRIYLPEFTEIEGIHGTFGLCTLLIFPLFVIYAFNRGQHRLIQTNTLGKLTQYGKPIWWYTLHRLVNTFSILALTFAVFSGKMMDEKWLPEGELDRVWYNAHLVSWLILVICILLHLLMNIRVGGVSLIVSMVNWRFRSEDSPRLWRRHFSTWRDRFGMLTVKQWLRSRSLLKIIELFVLAAIILAWIVSLLKELLF